MLLAIDSATAACSVALIEGDRLIEERHELVGRGHAERLVPMIEDLLGGRRPSAIVVDCGPGSFTGLRVGLAAAQGLSIGWGIPLAGYSSLALLAAMAREQGFADIGASLHGGHGELFVQSYGGDPLRASDEIRSLPPREAAARICAAVVVGSGAEVLVAERGSGEALDLLPRAADVLLLPANLRDLPVRPIYGRSPDAKPQAPVGP
jgi:tRNA threonylcarbamoyl adenosine modification protein YeaZ